MADKCPVCGSDATIRERGEGMDGKAVDCPLCTGFKISDNAILGLKSKPGDKELLPYLTCHLRQAGEKGTVSIVASHRWREFAQLHKNTTFSQKSSKLLDLLATRSNFQPGGRIQVNPKLDWPLVDAGSENELEYLLNYLSEAHYVDRIKFHPALELTPKAWERFEKAGIGQGIPGRCFVAMSFDPSLNDAYDEGIFLALKSDCQMEPLRVDRIQHNEKICDKIVAKIRTCQFLVADVTLQRPGVYFEGGFAMGLGRPVIWSCREDDLKSVHFDTRQYNHIVWSAPADLRTQLTDRIKATIPGAV